jgi:hypothetical protein
MTANGRRDLIRRLKDKELDTSVGCGRGGEEKSQRKREAARNEDTCVYTAGKKQNINLT